MASQAGLELLIELKDEASRKLDKVKGRVDAFGGVVGSVAKGAVFMGTAVLGGATLAGGAMLKMAADAAPIEGIRDAFQGLTGDAGTMIAALRKGSLGMVKDVDLMKNYNSAAQLVSKTFADQLPGAMGYLSKVSAATGENMGYMINSLVKGVGRLSPMILDNLGIQVALSEAVDRAAEMFGVETDALTKAQQQAGMMSVVMEKLKANTAAMPEITGSAAQQWAAFQTTLANVKDQVGVGLIPVLSSLLDAISPIITGLADRLVPAAAKVGEWLGEVIPAAIEAVTSVLPGLQEGFADLILGLQLLFQADVGSFTELLWTGLYSVGEALGFTDEQMGPFLDKLYDMASAVLNTVVPALETAWEWLATNVPAAIETLVEVISNNAEPVLAALGAIILSVVLPALWAWAAAAVASATATIAALMPIIAPIAAIAAAAAVLALAWKHDWAGIRTTLTAVWDSKLKPIFEQLEAWLGENLPKAIETLRGFWEDILAPALEAVWKFTQDNVIPILKALAGVWLAAVSKAVEALAGLWQNILYPALQNIWTFIKENVGPVLVWLNDKVIGSLKGSLDGVGTAVSKVTGFLGTLAEKLRGLTLPDWLTPGSMTPFEAALHGIARAMGSLSGDAVPDFENALRSLNSILGSTRGVFESLSVELPEIKVNLAEALSGVMGIARGAASWISGEWTKDKAFLEWFMTDIRKVLERFAGALKPLQSLLSTTKGILDVASVEAARVKLSVKTFFDNVLAIMEAINEWRGRGESAEAIWDYIIGWQEAIGVHLQDWADTLKPLQTLLSTMKGILGVTANEVGAVNLSVATFFGNILQLMESINEWRGRGEDAAAIWSYIAGWQEAIGVHLQDWADALKPLQSLLSIMKGVLDVTAKEVDEVRLSVSAFFGNLHDVLEALDEYRATNKRQMKDIAGYIWNLKHAFTDWAEGLTPLQSVLSTVTGVLDLASKEVVEVKLSVSSFFETLHDLLKSIDEYRATHKATMIDIRDLIADLPTEFADWAEALQPLQSVLSVIGGILGTAAKEVAEVKLSVSAFFGGLETLLQETVKYLAGGGTEMHITTPLERITALIADLPTEFADWAKALQPLQAVLSVVRNILATTAKEVGAMKLSVSAFFGNLETLLREIVKYLAVGETGLSITTPLERITELISALPSVFEDWAKALQPLQSVLSVVRGVLDAAAAEVATVKLVVASFFGNLEMLLEEIVVYLHITTAGTSNIEQISLLIALLPDVFEDWAKGLAPLQSVLSVVQGILGTASGEVEEVKLSVRAFFGSLETLLEEIVLYLHTTIAGTSRIEQITELIALLPDELAGWAEALQPLSSVLSVVTGILSLAQKELEPGKLDIASLFASVQQILEDAITAISEADFQSTIARLTEDIQTQMDTVAAGVASVASIISSGIAALMDLGKETPDFDLSKLTDLLENIRESILEVMAVFEGVTLDTTRLAAIEASAKSVRGVLNAMDGMARAIKDINVPDVKKLRNLVTVLAGGTDAEGRVYEGIITILAGVPVLPESARKGFESAEGAMNAVKNVIKVLHELRYTKPGSLAKTVDDVKQVINVLIANLITMLDELGPDIETLKAKATQFGLDMIEILKHITDFWQREGEDQPVHGIFNEFIGALRTMFAELMTELDTVLAYLGDEYVAALNAIDWQPAATTIAGTFSTGLLDGLDTALAAVRGMVQPGGTFPTELSGYSWFSAGQSVMGTFMDGLTAAAQSRIITIHIELQTDGLTGGGEF